MCHHFGCNRTNEPDNGMIHRSFFSYPQSFQTRTQPRLSYLLFHNRGWNPILATSSHSLSKE
jgi:hypothetical protein